jgi:sRNA-binding carbon storage regulator CsrA
MLILTRRDGETIRIEGPRNYHIERINREGKRELRRRQNRT